jgi:hypothetical protein
MMNEKQFSNWEGRLQIYAADFPYPPTPDIATGVARQLQQPGTRGASRHRLLVVRLALAIIVVAIALLSVPAVRAAVVEFLQIGAVRIFPNRPAPTETVTPFPPAGVIQPATQAPVETPTALASMLDLAGETTLEEARLKSGFTLPLPDYPAGLGPPDHVYLQDSGDAFVILAWMDPEAPQSVLLSLQFIGPQSWMIGKYQPRVVQETHVGERAAIWTTGPYPLLMSNGEVELKRLVTGHVLIWQDKVITYRLESDFSLNETLKVAESLH